MRKMKNYSWIFLVDVVLTAIASMAFANYLFGEQVNIVKVGIGAGCILFSTGCTLFAAKKFL